MCHHHKFYTFEKQYFIIIVCEKIAPAARNTYNLEESYSNGVVNIAIYLHKHSYKKKYHFVTGTVKYTLFSLNFANIKFREKSRAIFREYKISRF